MPTYLLQKQPDGPIRVVEKPESTPPEATDGPGDYWLTRMGTDWTITVTHRPPHRPINVTLPRILGAAEVGEVLTADPGAWLDAGTLALQWGRAGEPIPGATGATYPITPADAGFRPTLTVVAGNAVGTTHAMALAAKVPAPAAQTSAPTLSVPDLAVTTGVGPFTVDLSTFVTDDGGDAAIAYGLTPKTGVSIAGSVLTFVDTEGTYAGVAVSATNSAGTGTDTFDFEITPDSGDLYTFSGTTPTQVPAGARYAFSGTIPTTVPEAA